MLTNNKNFMHFVRIVTVILFIFYTFLSIVGFIVSILNQDFPLTILGYEFYGIKAGILYLIIGPIIGIFFGIFFGVILYLPYKWLRTRMMKYNRKD